jgi:hypothetical protein
MPTKKPDTAEAIVMEIGRRHYTAVLEDYYEGPFALLGLGGDR